MRRSRFVAGIAWALIASFGAVSSGCFGSFRLTNKLYQVNKSVDEKYIRSVVTWIFIIPYGFTAILDFLVFNVIEFWSGENPVASATVTKVYARGDGKAILTLARDGAATLATIERYEGGTLVSTLRIRDDGSGKVTSVETTPAGMPREITAVPRPDGSMDVTVASETGVTRERFAAAAVQAEAARVAAGPGGMYTSSGGSGTLSRLEARLPAHGG